MGIEFVDRYSATGIPRPDPATVCPGPCEGMGVVPVKLTVSDGAPSPTPELEQAFLEAIEAGQEPDDMGYIFVTCPTCKGTRLRG